MSRLTLSTVCVFLLLCGAASVDVKTRQKRDSRIQTQGLLNSVDIDLAAAADRSRFRAGNTLTADKAHEKISAEAKGDFSFSFREAKNVVTDKVNHGQGNPFVLMDQEFVENLVKSDDKIGGVLDTVAGVFGKKHGPMYQFLGEMVSTTVRVLDENYLPATILRRDRFCHCGSRSTVHTFQPSHTHEYSHGLHGSPSPLRPPFGVPSATAPTQAQRVPSRHEQQGQGHVPGQDH